MTRVDRPAETKTVDGAGDGNGRTPGNGNPAEYFRAAADYSAVHTASAHGRSGLPVGVRRVSSTKRSTRGTL